MSEWKPISTAPMSRWLLTCRAGEKGTNVTASIDGVEWYDRQSRTTVTHSTFLPPTHWLVEVPFNPRAGGNAVDLASGNVEKVAQVVDCIGAAGQD